MVYHSEKRTGKTLLQDGRKRIWKCLWNKNQLPPYVWQKIDGGIGMKIKRETFMNIAITLMWIAIAVIVSFLLCFPKMINEWLYYRIMEAIVIVQIADKLLYWACGKIDKFERGKK